jgi:hypothetical protein
LSWQRRFVALCAGSEPCTNHMRAMMSCLLGGIRQEALLVRPLTSSSFVQAPGRSKHSRSPAASFSIWFWEVRKTGWSTETFLIHCSNKIPSEKIGTALEIRKAAMFRATGATGKHTVRELLRQCFPYRQGHQDAACFSQPLQSGTGVAPRLLQLPGRSLVSAHRV